MKKLLTILLISLAWPVFASEALPVADYPYVTATNSPQTLSATFDPCSCVSYYKYKAGISQATSLGNAKDLFPWFLEPRDSGMIITYDGGGHVAYYEKTGDILKIFEANYIPCKTSTRQIRVGDPLIRGFR